MAIALVQTASGGSISWTNTAGNLLIAASRGPTTATVSDGVNNWLKAVAINNGTNGISIWYAANCAVGLRSLTFSAGASQNVSIEYSGAALSGVLAQTNKATGVSTAYTAGSIITTMANAIVIGANSNETANGLTDVPTGGFTDRINASGNVFAADQSTTTPGTFTYGGGWSGLTETWAAAVAVFLPPPGASLGLGTGSSTVWMPNPITNSVNF